jgi:hypothetical protein
MQFRHNSLLLSLLSFEKRRKRVQISCMALLARKHIYQGDRKKRRLGMVVPYLIYIIHVELRCTVCSLGFLHRTYGNYALLSEPWV